MALAAKHKVSSTFRNEAIEVFYGTKSSISDILNALRTFVSEKAQALSFQTIKPAHAEEPSQTKESLTHIVQQFEEDMVALKRSSAEYSVSVRKLNEVLKQSEDTIKKDRLSVKADFNMLLEALASTNEILLTRKALGGDSSAQRQHESVS